jgi:hypothetical protein
MHAKYEAIIRITAAAICGSDLHMYKERSNARRLQLLESFPADQATNLRTISGCWRISFRLDGMPRNWLMCRAAIRARRKCY